jgi:hypothetical protein
VFAHELGLLVGVVSGLDRDDLVEERMEVLFADPHAAHGCHERGIGVLRGDAALPPRAPRVEGPRQNVGMVVHRLKRGDHHVQDAAQRVEPPQERVVVPLSLDLDSVILGRADLMKLRYEDGVVFYPGKQHVVEPVVVPINT